MSCQLPVASCQSTNPKRERGRMSVTRPPSLTLRIGFIILGFAIWHFVFSISAPAQDFVPLDHPLNHPRPLPIYYPYHSHGLPVTVHTTIYRPYWYQDAWGYWYQAWFPVADYYTRENRCYR